MVVIQVPEVLREKLGPEGSKALVDLLNQTGGLVRDDVLKLGDERSRRHLAEEFSPFRQDLAREFALIREEFAKVRQEMAGEFARVRQEFAAVREEMSDEFTKVRQEMGLVRSDTAGEFAKVRQEIADVRVEVATVKSDLTWRLFYFWTAHLVAIAGLLLAFFKMFGS